MTYQFGRIWQVLGNQNKEIRLNLHKQGEKKEQNEFNSKKIRRELF